MRAWHRLLLLVGTIVLGFISLSCVALTVPILLALCFLGMNLDSGGYTDKPVIRESTGLFSLILTYAVALVVALRNVEPIEVFDPKNAALLSVVIFVAVSLVTLAGMAFILLAPKQTDEPKPGEVKKHAYDWASIMLTRAYLVVGTLVVGLTVYMAAIQKLPGQPFSVETELPVREVKIYRVEGSEGLAATAILDSKKFNNKIPKQLNLKVQLPKELGPEWHTENVYVFLGDRRVEDTPVQVRDSREKDFRVSTWLLDGLTADKDHLVVLYIFPTKKEDLEKYIDKVKSGSRVTALSTKN